MKRTAVLVFMAMILAGCKGYDIEEILLSREDISLTQKGRLLFSHDAATCQLGYSSDRNEFRVYDDELGNFFIVRCNARPDTEGQTLKADLTWTTETNTKTSKGLEFKVQKTGADGRIWMWCESESIGVVVKELE